MQLTPIRISHPAAVLGPNSSQHSEKLTAWPARTRVVGHIATCSEIRNDAPRRRARRAAMSQADIFSQDAGDDNHVLQGSGRHYNRVLDLLNDSTKWVVSAGAGVTVLWRRDALTMWCIIGSVVAALLCKVIKRLINGSRPVNARAVDPGMPSSHASSLAYFGSYIVWSFTYAMGPSAVPVGSAYAVTAITLGMAWLRVLLGYHTYPQLAAGLVLGSGVACCWFALFLAAVEPAIAAQPVNEVRLMATTILASALFAVAFFRRWTAGPKGNQRNA